MQGMILCLYIVPHSQQDIRIQLLVPPPYLKTETDFVTLLPPRMYKPFHKEVHFYRKEFAPMEFLLIEVDFIVKRGKTKMAGLLLESIPIHINSADKRTSSITTYIKLV